MAQIAVRPEIVNESIERKVLPLVSGHRGGAYTVNERCEGGLFAARYANWHGIREQADQVPPLRLVAVRHRDADYDIILAGVLMKERSEDCEISHVWRRAPCCGYSRHHSAGIRVNLE